jgi:hypothetical protein
MSHLHALKTIRKAGGSTMRSIGRNAPISHHVGDMFWAIVINPSMNQRLLFTTNGWHELELQIGL